MRRAPFAVLAIVLLACASKKELDQTAEKLLAAYAAQDYEQFKALVHPEIAAQIPAEKFAYTAKAIKSLGEPTGRSMRGISVKAGGPSEGQYVLTYAGGEVQFELKVLEGTIVGFNLTGDLVTQALRKTVAAEFKVAAFDFVNPADGSAKVGTTFTQGDDIAFRLQVLGLTEKERDVHLRLKLEIVTPDGEVKYSKTIIDERTKLEEGALPVASPTGSVKAGPPGPYRLRLSVEDVLGSRSHFVEQDLTIKAPT